MQCDHCKINAMRPLHHHCRRTAQTASDAYSRTGLGSHRDACQACILEVSLAPNFFGQSSPFAIHHIIPSPIPIAPLPHSFTCCFSSPTAASHIPPQCCPRDYHGLQVPSLLSPSPIFICCMADLITSSRRAWPLLPAARPSLRVPSAPHSRDMRRRRSRAPSSVSIWVQPTRPLPSWRARFLASSKTLRVCDLSSYHHHHHQHKHHPPSK